MLHTKFRGNRHAGSGEEIFEGFLPYMRPPGFWGTGEQGHLIQGNRGTKANFSGEQRNKEFISGGKGNRCTPPPWEWEGLIYGRGGDLGHVTSILHQFYISLHLKTFIQNLVQNNTVVSVKIRFEFLNVHDLGPRSRNDDLQY